MKNPLRKRLPRELKSEFGKYLVIFLLLVGTIGFVSGFLVADGSLIIAYNESFEKYNIEDGNFRLEKKMNRAQRKAIGQMGITIYDNYYAEEPLSNGSTMRIFQNRQEVNKICLMEGKMPDEIGEIAIDRMYADNNDIHVGDVLETDVDGAVMEQEDGVKRDGSVRSWKVTGLVALSDYSCLFSDNNDSMFDAIKFGVGVVTEEEFAQFDKEELYYSYSWIYDTSPKGEDEERKMAEELMDQISGEVRLKNFVPRYLNQAIQFTGEDMGGDRAMMIVLLYIVIVIMAFVFGVTVSNTISKEANVIGTLRASGFTRGELIRHYMETPIFVTLAGAVLGNILGYTVFKDVCANMYYGSYSLPTYVTVWNMEAFLLTTVVPVALMFVINFLILYRKLTLSPLKFLRRDLSRKKQRRAFPLSTHIPFFGRFRMRIIFQNVSNYVVLLVGILFANLLLLFGLILPSILSHYQAEIQNNMLSSYQYMLQVPMDAVKEDRKLESLLRMMMFRRSVETENKDAEEFSAYSLKTLGDVCKSEEILLYGVKEDSRYVPLDISGGKVYVSSGYASKYDVVPGDTITLKEPFESTQYSFEISGIYEYEGTLSVFMGQEKLNQTFDLDDDYFVGYFSATEITDIDEEYIGSVIDIEDLTKISRQLTVSMGNMMNMVDVFAVMMFMILIYLLSKIIIEKNVQSISMAKILGYTDGEISRLYIVSTSIMVVVFLLLSLPIETVIMKVLFRYIIMSMNGWITFYMEPLIYVKMFLMGVLTYAAVVFLEYRKIRKVPMNEALKNVE